MSEDPGAGLRADELPAGPSRTSEAILQEAVRHYVLLRTGQVWLALPAGNVEQIRAYEGCSLLPTAPPHILGLVSLSGRAVPVLDLARWLELADGAEALRDGATHATETHPRVVVVKVEDVRAALRADQVLGAMAVPETALQQPQATALQRLRGYTEVEFKVQDTVVAALRLGDLLEQACVR